MNTVRVRFGPSPTGFLHIGSLRTALFNWLWAKKHNGQFILRIEDTDQERFMDGAVENIIEALKWYGLDFDEGPVYQSKRLNLYKEHVDKLLESGNAYRCFCSSERLDEVRKIQQTNKQATKYDGLCRSLSDEAVKKKLDAKESSVVRLKVPHDGTTVFEDMVYGKIEVANKDIDDQVLMKSDGFPTYHLANVVDDHEMKISHVIRAQEWLPSTPKHIILYQAFGWDLPVFAHLPMVLGPDRSKLSKRHGAAPALEYKEMGYLPEAVLNFIALLGWNPKTDQEVFLIDDLIKEFDLKKINKANAIFNKEKLDWMNGQYFYKLLQEPIDKFADEVHRYYVSKSGSEKYSKEFIKKVLPVSATRMTTLADFKNEAKYVTDDSITYDAVLLIPKGGEKDETLRALKNAQQLIEKIDDSKFSEDVLEQEFIAMIERGDFSNKTMLWPVRVALTKRVKSPGVFEYFQLLGKEVSIERMKVAIQNLQKS